jgi:hypothetical protein
MRGPRHLQELLGRIGQGVRSVVAPVEVLGIALFVLASINRIPVLWEPIHTYDEGLLLSISNLLLKGGAVFRDASSSYPPGIYLAIAALWKVFGVSVMAAHVLALVLHLGVALLTGRLAGRMVGRAMCWVPAGVVLGWIRALELIPFAWLAGLLMALFTVELTLRALASDRSRDWALAGVSFAAISFFRHDLFVYVSVGFLPLFALPRSWARRLGIDRPLRAPPALWGPGAAAIALAVFWIPVVAIAGVRPVLGDLLLDPIRHVAPARDMPLPVLFTLVPSSFGVHVPAFLIRRFEGAVMISLAAPVVALALFLWLRRRAPARAVATLFLGLVGLATLPQLLGRTDPNHALYCLAPGVALCYALFETAGRWLGSKIGSRVGATAASLAVIAAGVLLLANPVYPRVWPVPAVLVPTPDPLRSLALPRLGSITEAHRDYAGYRRHLIKFVQDNSGPGDAVFFGNQAHRGVDLNESELYFLVDRRPGTRHVNFDPNLVDRAPVQAEMIEELERNDVRVVVLSSRYSGYGPGSPLLDDYLASRYHEVGHVGPYSLRLRVQH